MEENKDIENIDELSRSLIEQYEMKPPEGEWDSLDAELTKKQATIYKKRANRFKILSIALALLLLSFIIYHYFSPIRETNREGRIIDRTSSGNYATAQNPINSDSNSESSTGFQHSSEKNSTH